AAQHVAGAVAGETIPLVTRIVTAMWYYALYVGATFWPFRLAVFCPLTRASIAYSTLAGFVLAAFTLFAWSVRRSMPYVLIGWLWFVGTLLPVSGLIQFGGQSMADRYSYIPHIGLLVMLVWAAAD